MNEAKIQLTYHDHVIKHDDGHDHWFCTIRGHERIFPILSAAKAAIDAPVREKSTFKHSPAYYVPYNEDPIDCTVTSVAMPPRYASDKEYYRIAYPKVSTIGGFRSRQVVPGSDVFAATPANAQLVASIRRLREDIDKLQKLKSEATRKLTKFKPELE